MINRKHRFHGYGSLRFVYQKGKTYRGQYGSLKCIANTRREEYRLAVVVSRKVHKSAVVRNRIRRRIYEIIRNEEANIHIPYDIVITVFSDQVATMDYQELRSRLLDKVVEAGIIASYSSAPQADHVIVETKE